MKKLRRFILFCILAIIAIYYLRSKGYLDLSKYIAYANIENKDIAVNSLQSNNSVFYYNKLSDNDKKIYNKILYAISRLDKKVMLNINTETDQNKLSSEVGDIFSYILADHPEIWYVTPGYEIKVTNYLGVNVVNININYTVDTLSQLNSQVSLIKQKIEDIISKNIKANMTDYQKELVIHDYLANTIVYYKYSDINSIPDDKHTAYSAIIDKSAVCDGYTKAYQLILNKINIKNIFVEGTADLVPHAWNLVKLDNEYYHTDLTSSATLMSQTKANMPVHVYFNVTDLDILETHTIKNRQLLPEAVATKFNYYKIENKEIDSLNNFNNSLREIIVNNENNELLELKITNVYNAADKLVDGLYNLDFNNMKSTRQTKVSYNKELNVYIIPIR